MVATLGGRFNDGELFGSPFMLNLLKHEFLNELGVDALKACPELFDKLRAGLPKGCLCLMKA